MLEVRIAIDSLVFHTIVGSKCGLMGLWGLMQDGVEGGVQTRE
jgi:hypothetical protein